MKVKYHLEHLEDDSLMMTIDYDGRKFVTRSRQKPNTLTQLFKLCKNNISTVLWKNGLGTGHYIEWDEDTTDIQDMKIVGLSTYKKKVVAPVTDVHDMVYEVIKVEDNWTVIKHDCPLLTWDEAVAELKKRI